MGTLPFTRTRTQRNQNLRKRHRNPHTQGSRHPYQRQSAITPRTMSQVPACPGSSHGPPQSHTAVVSQDCMQGGDSTVVSGVPPHWSTEGPGHQGPYGASFHRADWPEGNPNGTRLVGRGRERCRAPSLAHRASWGCGDWAATACLLPAAAALPQALRTAWTGSTAPWRSAWAWSGVAEVPHEGQ